MPKFKLPHCFIFLTWIIVFCAILTYFIPSGSFDRTTKAYGKITQQVVVPGSFKELPKHISLRSATIGETVAGSASPVSVLGVLGAIPKGLKDAAPLIFYVFLIGAVIALIQQTGAINALLFVLIRRFTNKPDLLFFAIYMLLFSSASFMGIAAETIPFIPILLYLSKRMGYDRMFGIALLVVPIHLGWTTGVTNPFNAQVAQMIAELPIGSGIGLRLLLYLVFACLGFYFIMRYAKRVKKDPTRSFMKSDRFDLDDDTDTAEIPLQKMHVFILSFFVMAYAAILFAAQTMEWSLTEMSGGFIGIIIVVTLVSGMSGDEAMGALLRGLQTMIVPALVIGVARGISVVLQEGMIIDTILQHASATLSAMPKIFAGEGMLIFQSSLNFFIPSASGQALVSMPLMTPLADILGMTRQTAVLAFILGDGLSNIIIPTNGVLLAMLGVAHLPFDKWFKFIMPLFLVCMVVAMAFIALAITIGY